MMTATDQPLVRDYLARLREESRQLPVDQARELEADITEHLLAAIPHEASEAEVRNVLDRLGTPEELVTEAGGARVPTPGGSKSFASPGGAIICLVAAEILSVLLPLSVPLWIIGLVMMARATVWTERQKLWGMLALGSGFPVVTVLLLVSTVTVTGCSQVYENGKLVEDTCSGFDPVAAVFIGLTVAYLALQAFTIWRLVRSARRR